MGKLYIMIFLCTGERLDFLTLKIDELHNHARVLRHYVCSVLKGDQPESTLRHVLHHKVLVFHCIPQDSSWCCHSPSCKTTLTGEHTAVVGFCFCFPFEDLG